MSAIVPEELLDEAKALSSEPEFSTDSVRRRTVVGRAYYAAYHACFSFAQQLGYNPKSRFNVAGSGTPTQNMGMHAYLIHWLSNFNHATVAGIGRELGKLKELRCSADYDEPFSPPSAKDAKNTITKAERIIFSQCPGAISMIMGSSMAVNPSSQPPTASP